MSERYKKTLLAGIAVVFILAAAACGVQGVDTKPTEKTPEIAYEVIDSYGCDVTKGKGAIKGDSVPDAATAVVSGAPDVDTRPMEKTPAVTYRVIRDWDGYDVKEWEGAIKGDYVPDAATAQAIGDAVIKGIVGEEDFKELIGVFVEYDEVNGVWLVDRNLGPDTDGGGYACAIRKSNSEILTVVAGE